MYSTEECFLLQYGKRTHKSVGDSNEENMFHPERIKDLTDESTREMFPTLMAFNNGIFVIQIYPFFKKKKPRYSNILY